MSIGSVARTPPRRLCGAIGALRGPKHGGANEAAFEIQRRYAGPDEAEADIRPRTTVEMAGKVAESDPAAVEANFPLRRTLTGLVLAVLLVLTTFSARDRISPTQRRWVQLGSIAVLLAVAATPFVPE